MSEGCVYGLRVATKPKVAITVTIRHDSGVYLVYKQGQRQSPLQANQLGVSKDWRTL